MAEEIGVVIIDLDMPVMNGIEMIATLRLNPHFSALPVIVLSAFATDMPQPVHEVRSSLAGHLLLLRQRQAEELWEARCSAVPAMYAKHAARLSDDAVWAVCVH